MPIPNMLSPDRPLENPLNDRLGYAPFAKQLASAISRMAPQDGFVVAISGPWGTGKSTVLNFVKHYMNELPDHERPIVVLFNPWWFSGHEDLTRRFFAQLRSTVSKSDMIGSEVARRLGDFAEVVSESSLVDAVSAVIKVAGVTLPVKDFSRLAARALKTQQKDIVEIKADLQKALREQQKRIVVLIDDVDRLTAEEMRQLFRVVRAVADFPNVVYVMAFDREVVTKSLESIQGPGGSGEEYLEKIVQAPFELPPVERAALRQMLFSRLDEVLFTESDDSFDLNYWANVYFDGIDYFINTPRDVARLINTLSVVFPAVAGEVNETDFVAIETLRVFCSSVYAIVRESEAMFTGAKSISFGSYSDGEDARLKAFHDAWLDQVPASDRPAVKHLMLRLFPKLHAVWDNTSYTSNWLSQWRRERRVCSPSVFPVYFRLSLPEGGISFAELRNFLRSLHDTAFTGQTLLSLARQRRPDGMTRARSLLQRLEDYTENDIPTDASESLIRVLFDVGDDLCMLEGERREMFDLGIELTIGRVTRQLIMRLGSDARFDLFHQVAASGRAVATIVREVSVLGEQHGKHDVEASVPEESQTVTADQLAELEQIALQRIQQLAASGELLGSPRLAELLYSWADWGEIGDVKMWVSQSIELDASLARFVEAFLRVSFSRGMADAMEEKRPRLDPNWLERFIEPNQIIDRIRVMRKACQLTERQDMAITQFIKEYDLRQSGLDPEQELRYER